VLSNTFSQPSRVVNFVQSRKEFFGVNFFGARLRIYASDVCPWLQTRCAHLNMTVRIIECLKAKGVDPKLVSKRSEIEAAQEQAFNDAIDEARGNYRRAQRSSASF
jgi:hypothetical protein